MPLHLAVGYFWPGRQVKLKEDNDILKIFDDIEPVLLVEHPVSKEKGRLVRNSNHGRDYSATLDTLQQKLFEQMQCLDEAGVFLRHIRQLKGRYVRDQFQLIEQLIKGVYGFGLAKSAVLLYHQQPFQCHRIQGRLLLLQGCPAVGNHRAGTKPQGASPPVCLDAKTSAIRIHGCGEGR